MNDYERQIFNGKCPYIGNLCSADIDCSKCEVEEEERYLFEEEKIMTDTIKAEYNGYTGYAYGVSSFSVRDKDGTEIFHTGFCTERPQTEAECLEYLKETLDLLSTLRGRA